MDDNDSALCVVSSWRHCLGFLHATFAGGFGTGCRLPLLVHQSSFVEPCCCSHLRALVGGLVIAGGTKVSTLGALCVAWPLLVVLRRLLYHHRLFDVWSGFFLTQGLGLPCWVIAYRVVVDVLGHCLWS